VDNVVQFQRRVASPEVIIKPIELGYLQRAKHHTAGAVNGAVARLASDLCRDGVICEPATWAATNGCYRLR
jgi:hypothetical protein